MQVSDAYTKMTYVPPTPTKGKAPKRAAKQDCDKKNKKKKAGKTITFPDTFESPNFNDELTRTGFPDAYAPEMNDYLFI